MSDLKNHRAASPREAQDADIFHYEGTCLIGRQHALEQIVADLEVRAGTAFHSDKDELASALRTILRHWKTKLAATHEELETYTELRQTCHTEEHWADECPGDHGK